MDLIRDISPNDRVFLDPESYFKSGLEAVRLIDSVIAEEPRRILDLPCGHGRVLRALKVRFPESELVACDLDRDAVDFCAQTFGATPVYSIDDPRELEIGYTFDLIWVGSLLTHLPAHRWPSFIDAFDSLLEKDGALVLTTHGHRAAHVLRNTDLDFNLGLEAKAKLLACFGSGFAFEDYPKFTDYGISLSEPWWVMKHLERESLRLVSFLEAGWGNFQDVYALQKT